LAPKVSFFLVLLNKQAICAGKQFPIEVFGRFAGVVKAMFSKFDRKAMKRTSVQTSDKTFDHLFRNEFEVIELLKLLYVKDIVHSSRDKSFACFRKGKKSLVIRKTILHFFFRMTNDFFQNKKGIRTFVSYTFSS